MPGQEPSRTVTSAGGDAAVWMPNARARVRTGSSLVDPSTIRKAIGVPFSASSAEGFVHEFGHRIGVPDKLIWIPLYTNARASDRTGYTRDQCASSGFFLLSL